MANTDEILQRIQDRLDARANGGGVSANISNRGHGSGFDVPRAAISPTIGAFKLTPEQITSKVFIVAPSQIDFIAETFANAVADAMNMRNFAPKIREIAQRELINAFGAAKTQGKGKYPDGKKF